MDQNFTETWTWPFQNLKAKAIQSSIMYAAADLTDGDVHHGGSTKKIDTPQAARRFINPSLTVGPM